MDHRFVLLAVLGLGCVSVATLSCSGPDPGTIVFAERAGPLQASPTPGTSSGGGGDGGTVGPTDGGGSSSGGPDPIFGTTAFAYQNPGIAANGQNAAHLGTVVGKNCVMATCHAPGEPKVWLIGGTVFDGPTSNTTVAQAEVRVVDPTGKELAKAYTDPNGNFWLEKGALPNLPNNAMVGVRTATAVQRMGTALTGPTVGCNNAAGCHGDTNMKLWVK
jgi:hypothetical protein